METESGSIRLVKKNEPDPRAIVMGPAETLVVSTYSVILLHVLDDSYFELLKVRHPVESHSVCYTTSVVNRIAFAKLTFLNAVACANNCAQSLPGEPKVPLGKYARLTWTPELHQLSR